MLKLLSVMAKCLTITAGLSLSAAGSVQAFDVLDDGTTSVTVGALFLPADAGLFIAAEQGYFAAEKIKVNFKRVISGADLVSFVATDEVDVGSGGMSPGLLNAFSRGVDLEIVAGKSIMLKPEFGSSMLLVRKDLAESGELTSIADLKGHKIAVNSLQSTSLNYLRRILAKANIAPDDVDMIALRIPQLVPALINKAIDVALVFGMTPESIARAQAVKVKGGRILSVTEDGDVTNMMFYSPGFSASPIATRFMVAFLKGQRDYYDAIIAGTGDRHSVCEDLRKYATRMPENCANFPMPGVDPNGKISVKSLETFQREWLEWGITRKAVDIPAHINSKFLDAAVAELGEYKAK